MSCIIDTAGFRISCFSLLASLILPAPGLHAQDAVDAWFERVEQTQAAQPHWITPVVTVTPRLEQEFRFDLFHQDLAGGFTTLNIGGGKGLELIPSERVEVILGIPAYLDHGSARAHDGFGDTSFLVKYRLFSGNEEAGNYIVTAFLGASVPTGSYSNGAEHAVITPTLAAGKGWKDFSVQSTLGAGIPTGDIARLGRPILSNTAFQYRVARRFWPEFEINSTFWPDGVRSGKKQVFLTPGLVIGRIPLRRRLGLTFGAGFQIAATHFHTYNHSLIFTIRLPFS
ncbi:MAG TPA: transporter [Bryobacteraceae bacterium]|nr:transporter [Bryobacteraceae bacterium]